MRVKHWRRSGLCDIAQPVSRCTWGGMGATSDNTGRTLLIVRRLTVRTSREPIGLQLSGCCWNTDQERGPSTPIGSATRPPTARCGRPGGRGLRRRRRGLGAHLLRRRARHPGRSRGPLGRVPTDRALSPACKPTKTSQARIERRRGTLHYLPAAARARACSSWSLEREVLMKSS